MKQLTLHPDRPRQTLDNIGASACWWTDYVWRAFPSSDFDAIARLLFDKESGAGLSCLRFNIGAGSAWYDTEWIENWNMRSECFQHGPAAPYDWTVHAGQRRLLELAKSFGTERTIAFANSPPAFLTANGHTRCDESTGTTNLPHGAEPAFAKFLTDVLAHFSDIGLPFDYISPINEPQVPWDDAKQEGCRYSNEDSIRLTLALSKELAARNLSTRILANECNNLMSLPDIESTEPLLVNVPGMNRYHGWQYGGKYCEMVRDYYDLPFIREAVAPVVAAHSYDTVAPGMMTPVRQVLKETLDRYGGLSYWMTEYCVLGEFGAKRDLGMDTALHVAAVMHADFAVADASAWQWWLAVSGGDWKDGLVYVDLDEAGHAGGIHPSKTLWAMAHYARFLRPGSRRLELDGTDFEEGVLATAWVNTKEKLVVVLVNTGEEPVEIRLVGVGEPGILYLTDEKRTLESERIEFADSDGFTLPPRCLATFTQ